MRKNILNLTAFLVPAIVVLSGCSERNLGSWNVGESASFASSDESVTVDPANVYSSEDIPNTRLNVKVNKELFALEFKSYLSGYEDKSKRREELVERANKDIRQTLKHCNYILLKKCTSSFKADELIQLLNDTDGLPSEKQESLLVEYYGKSLDEIQKQMQPVVRNPLLETYQGQGNIDLSKSQLDRLYADGYLDVELSDKLYGYGDNVRIQSIELVEDSIRVAEVNSAYDEGYGSLTQLEFSLGAEGQLTYDGQRYQFQYTEASCRSIYSWDSQIQYFPEEHLRINNAKDALSEQQVGTLPKHAGIAKMRITKRYDTGNIKLTSARVRIQYSFSIK